MTARSKTAAPAAAASLNPQAEHPPYDLPPERAQQAAEVYREMVAAGVAPNLVVMHTLMDCQVRLLGARQVQHAASAAQLGLGLSWLLQASAQAWGGAAVTIT